MVPRCLWLWTGDTLKVMISCVPSGANLGRPSFLFFFFLPRVRRDYYYLQNTCRERWKSPNAAAAAATAAELLSYRIPHSKLLYIPICKARSASPLYGTVRAGGKRGDVGGTMASARITVQPSIVWTLEPRVPCTALSLFPDKGSRVRARCREFILFILGSPSTVHFARKSEGES